MAFKWDSSFVLNVPLTGTCVGETRPSRIQDHRRCANPISFYDRVKTLDFLKLLNQRNPRREDLRETLEDLARVTLCQNLHREGATRPGYCQHHETVEKWRRQIREYLTAYHVTSTALATVIPTTPSHNLMDIIVPPSETMSHSLLTDQQSSDIDFGFPVSYE
jgi:hypothetical protein